MAIDNVKKFIYDFARQYRFNNMSPVVRARYNDYVAKNDFAGNMQWWHTELEGNPLPDLAPGKMGELFDLFNETFENMFDHQSDYNHDEKIKDFISNWYGPYKTFGPSKPVPGVDDGLKRCFIEDTTTTPPTPGLLTDPHYRPRLERIFKRQMGDIFTSNSSYQDFVDDIKKQKYKKDPTFRRKMIEVANYIQTYSDPMNNGGDPEVWPQGTGTAPVAPHIDFTAYGMNADPKQWFKHDYYSSDPAIRSYAENKFKADYKSLLAILITNEELRDAFAKHETKNTITSKISSGIKDTGYDDPKSDDFVEPKTTEHKNIWKRAEDKLNSFYENHLRKFSEPLRNTRMQFTQQSLDIAKAFDKEKIKPTDGIDGIVSKKDAIMKRLATSTTARSHFKWFCETMEYLKSKYPNEYSKALYKGTYLQFLVSHLIIKAVSDNKIKEAKTAMNLLSTMKYGITTSKTMDATKKEEFVIFSDSKLSWNKSEPVKTVSKIIDKTAHLAFQATGRVIAGIHNTIQHGRTKLPKNISKLQDLRASYQTWATTDAQDLRDARNANNAHNVETRLRTLAAGGGLSGTVITPANIETVKATFNGMAPTDPNYSNLESDINDYEDAASRKDLVDNWREHHPDYFSDLASYWNVMENLYKTHRFIGAMENVKRRFLQNDAARIEQQALARFGTLSYT